MTPRVGAWLREQIATVGQDVLTGKTDAAGGAAKLAGMIERRDKVLVRALVEPYAADRLAKWLSKHGSQPVAEDDAPQLTLPGLFPGLPRTLETSPGRFAHLGVMTGADWDAALRQAETKASNATGYAESVRAAYDRVRPLLDGDLTTADVAEQIETGHAVADSVASA